MTSYLKRKLYLFQCLYLWRFIILFIFSIFGFQARAQNENNSIIQQHTDSVSLSVKQDTLAAVLPDSTAKRPANQPKKE